MISIALATLLFAAAPSPAPSPPPAPAPAPAVAAAPALAAAPTLEEIVKRASATLERKPGNYSCAVSLKALQFDSDGKVEETQESELGETWKNGVAEQGLATKRSTNGKPYTAKEMAEADETDRKQRQEMKEHEAKGEGNKMEAPLAAGQLALHKFALLRQEALGGRQAYVLSIEPASSEPHDERTLLREGTAWIDAQSFLPLRIETHPKPLPNHVEKMEIDEEFMQNALGEALHKSLVVDAAGGILFIHRHYRVETSWHDCK